jgi:hypothetical protein
MKMIWLEPADPELIRAWGQIAERYGDPTCLDPQTGEAWEYMGTAWWADEDQGVHEFRHRHLPAAGAPERRNIPTSKNWTPSLPDA